MNLFHGPITILSLNSGVYILSFSMSPQYNHKATLFFYSKI